MRREMKKALRELVDRQHVRNRLVRAAREIAMDRQVARFFVPVKK